MNISIAYTVTFLFLITSAFSQEDKFRVDFFGQVNEVTAKKISILGNGRVTTRVEFLIDDETKISLGTKDAQFTDLVPNSYVAIKVRLNREDYDTISKMLNKSPEMLGSYLGGKHADEVRIVDSFAGYLNKVTENSVEMSSETAEWMEQWFRESLGRPASGSAHVVFSIDKGTGFSFEFRPGSVSDVVHHRGEYAAVQVERGERAAEIKVEEPVLASVSSIDNDRLRYSFMPLANRGHFRAHEHEGPEHAAGEIMFWVGEIESRSIVSIVLGGQESKLTDLVHGQSITVLRSGSKAKIYGD
jgi:hypothetical protein